MNIFVLSADAHEAGAMHCDRHVCKMIVEYAQMLSTAHRFHDGERTPVTLPNGKVKTLLLLPGEGYTVAQTPGKPAYKALVTEPRCYNATHANHPCAIWARATDANYDWLYRLFSSCLDEYAKRYGRTHATARLMEFLSCPPHRIHSGAQTPFALAMPDEFKDEDAVQSYRRFYVSAKARFAKWKNTPTPWWFNIEDN